MRYIAFFLEEESAQELLKGLLPRLLPSGVEPRYIVFEGKSDLESQLAGKLRGWRLPETRFVVLRDKDSADCREVKERLRALCIAAGKTETLVRIACHEIESWYLGDLSAVERAFEIKGIAKQQGKSKYRDPDKIAAPVQELRKITRDAYQKVSGSRSIGPLLSPEENLSHSFKVFVQGIQKLLK